MPKYRNRQRRDQFSAWLARGVAMLVLLLVILLVGYLLIAVIPLGSPGQADPASRAGYSAESGNSVLLAFNIDRTRATRVLSNGQVTRFAPQTGLLHGQFQLQDWLSLSEDGDFHIRQLVFLPDSDGIQQEYLLLIDYLGQARLLKWQGDELTDEHRWPTRFTLAAGGQLQKFSAALTGNQLIIAAQIQLDDQLQLQRFVIDNETAAGSSLTAKNTWALQQSLSSLLLHNQRILAGLSEDNLPVDHDFLNSPVLQIFSLAENNDAELNDAVEPVTQSINLPDIGASVNGVYTLEQNMLLVHSQNGNLYQLVDHSYLSTDPSVVPMPVAATYYCGTGGSEIVVAADKRWFGCVDDQQRARLFYAGRQQPVWLSDADMPVQNLALTGQQLLIDNGSSLQYLERSDAPVPDSKLLWRSVWYPGYQQPAFIWQPAASASGGPKFSVTPLLFGTIKAAILALLFGVPFALLGAIYTSLILARKWRERLKPVVEMLEAMPTVIIGFLAAIWLAPYLQNHLLICLLLLLALPFMLVLLGYFWSSMLSQRVSKRWRTGLPVLLIAALIVILTGVGWLLEWLLFGGQLSAWLEQQWGWTYDLRNALVVGVALGLAVTPTIFALCEDALTAVPKHLRLGAVALGASRWQAVWQVVVPCAASGLLAAILIGLGRALGETMIVLMAASNTPLIELSPLRGLQAIAPTLAIEMPEAEPGGIHFRVLLLCALILFAITLLANTLAELIRERLRRRYQI